MKWSYKYSCQYRTPPTRLKTPVMDSVCLVKAYILLSPKTQSTKRRGILGESNYGVLANDIKVLEDGTITDWRTADYLFSNDASCLDTLRIFASRDYLWSKVTIFHSLFLFTCEKRRSVNSVCIGHYVLPPVTVQNELRNAFGRLIWENEDEPSVPRTEDELSEADVSRGRSSDSSDTDISESHVLLCGGFQDYPVSNMLTGYVSMDSLQKYSDNLCDFHAECFRCSICSAHCRLPHT